MRKLGRYLLQRFVAGLLILGPLYLCALLLLKAMHSAAGLVAPIAGLLPDWLPADRALSMLLVVLLCVIVGIAVGTRPGRAGWGRIERSLLQKIPGYTVLRAFTWQLAGEGRDQSWKPALVELAGGLVPAFIIEQLPDRFTIFVPSTPTPMVGSTYVVTPERVHPLDVPLAHAIRTLTRWGEGCGELVAAMEARKGA